MTNHTQSTTAMIVSNKLDIRPELLPCLRIDVADAEAELSHLKTLFAANKDETPTPDQQEIARISQRIDTLTEATVRLLALERRVAKREAEELARLEAETNSMKAENAILAEAVAWGRATLKKVDAREAKAARRVKAPTAAATNNQLRALTNEVNNYCDQMGC